MKIGDALTRYSPWRNNLMGYSGRSVVAVTRWAVAPMAVTAHIIVTLNFGQIAGAMAVIIATRAT